MAQWRGVAVPTSGNVNNIYFNKSLSSEEVVTILDTLEITQTPDEFGDYIGTYVVWANKDQTKSIGVMKINGVYEIAIVENGEQQIIFASEGNSLGFVGWNTEYNFYNFNDETMESFGSQNDKISNLFSISPFYLELRPFIQELVDILGRKLNMSSINAQDIPDLIRSSLIQGISFFVEDDTLYLEGEGVSIEDNCLIINSSKASIEDESLILKEEV